MATTATAAVAALAATSAGRASAFSPLHASRLPSAPSARLLGGTALYGEGLDTLRDYLKYSNEGIEKLRDQRRRGEKILEEIDSGDREMPKYFYEDFVEEPEPEPEDPTAIVADEWGQWDERDLLGPPIAGEWDPDVDPDPNVLDPQFEYVQTVPVDEDGVELMYDPLHGPGYPIDERTVVNPSESYIIDEKTANATSVPRDFPEDDDPEVQYNADVKSFRRSLKIVETYTDQWTGLEHPRHVARWHGNPALETYPQKPWTNNRFTAEEDKTDFDSMTPHRARRRAIELARSKNNEWLPRGASAAYHDERTQAYVDRGLLVGTTLPGECDPTVVERIRPALDVLGSVADLLSIHGGTVFRFHYHGLIKNKRGMAAWTGTLIEDCGVECTGVVFETGKRKRDPWYDHGDHWYGPY